MNCVICKKGPQQGVSIFRINAKGVAGLWACGKHVGQKDAPGIDPTVDLIVTAIERGAKEKS